MQAMTPPQNLDAEVSVLGSMILDPSTIRFVEGELSPVHFYKESHRKIYRGILETFAHEGVVDQVLLSEYFRLSGTFNEIGGPMYLLGLMESVPTAAYIEHYAKIVRDNWVRREYISASQQIMQSAYSSESVSEVVTLSERKLLELSRLLSGGSWANAKQVSSSVIDEYERRKKVIAEGGLPGIGTGLVDLDDLLAGGYQPSQLIVIVGRPAMGKTAALLTQALNMTKAQKRVAIFSAEMSQRELGERLVAMDRRFDLQKLIYPIDANERSDSLVYQGAENISQLPLYIDQSSGIGIAQLKSRARTLAVQLGGLDAIFVDYIQLLRVDGPIREQGIGDISQGLKELAIELDVPVIALSQLNRKVEDRPNKRPMLSDIRESGRIEQDANVVLGLYRDDYYDKDPKNPNAGIVEISVLKNRSGPSGVVKVSFNAKAARFENLEKGTY